DLFHVRHNFLHGPGFLRRLELDLLFRKAPDRFHNAVDALMNACDGLLHGHPGKPPFIRQIGSSDQTFLTRFSMEPILSITTRTTSPSFMNTCGSRAKPTPPGVPVRMMSPGSSVISSL